MHRAVKVILILAGVLLLAGAAALYIYKQYFEPPLRTLTVEEMSGGRLTSEKVENRNLCTHSKELVGDVLISMPQNSCLRGGIGEAYCPCYKANGPIYTRRGILLSLYLTASTREKLYNKFYITSRHFGDTARAAFLMGPSKWFSTVKDKLEKEGLALEDLPVEHSYYRYVGEDREGLATVWYIPKNPEMIDDLGEPIIIMCHSDAICGFRMSLTKQAQFSAGVFRKIPVEQFEDATRAMKEYAESFIRERHYIPQVDEKVIPLVAGPYGHINDPVVLTAGQKKYAACGRSKELVGDVLLGFPSDYHTIGGMTSNHCNKPEDPIYKTGRISFGLFRPFSMYNEFPDKFRGGRAAFERGGGAGWIFLVKLKLEKEGLQLEELPVVDGYYRYVEKIPFQLSDRFSTVAWYIPKNSEMVDSLGNPVVIMCRSDAICALQISLTERTEFVSGMFRKLPTERFEDLTHAMKAYAESFIRERHYTPKPDEEVIEHD